MAEVSIPPLDRIFLTGIWIGTMLYGMNAIIYVSALVLLLRKRVKSGGGQLFLILMATFLFSISTAYVGITFRQLLEAFVWGPPGGAIPYFAYEPNPLAISKLALYEVNVSDRSNVILIWRLWVVFGNNWKVIVAPSILECVHIIAGASSIARGSKPDIPVFDPIIHKWAITYWTMDLTVNVCVTLALAWRIWSIGHGVRGLGRNANQYVGVIATMVESGALFAAATLVVVVLFLTGNIAVVAALDSVVQLASITPMLIVVRVGLALHHGTSINSTTVGGASTTNVQRSGAATSALRFNNSYSANPKTAVNVSTYQEDDFGMDGLKFKEASRENLQHV